MARNTGAVTEGLKKRIEALSGDLAESKSNLSKVEAEKEALLKESKGAAAKAGTEEKLKAAQDQIGSLISEREKVNKELKEAKKEAEKVLTLIVDKSNLEQEVASLKAQLAGGGEAGAGSSGGETLSAKAGDIAATELSEIGALEEASEALDTASNALDATSGQEGLGLATEESQGEKGPVVETDTRPRGVPEELAPIARKAREYFDRQDYPRAERFFEKLLEREPENLFALSNLGVVRFRMGKFKQAEKALLKAVEADPEDSFSYETLGIVYYSQGKLDEAINVLTKSLTINPKSATAHNFLGIAASKKGWHEAAEDELRKAISLNPNYADAHFNLAVLYAMAKPPSLKLAKQHYDKALKGGALSNKDLEKIIYGSNGNGNGH